MSVTCPSTRARPAPNDQTTAWRILDGNDLEIRQVETRVDNFGGHWLVQTRDVDFPESLRGLTERCPQVKSLWWKKLDRDERGKQAPQWLEGEQVDERFVVLEHGARYWIDFDSGYSQGIFLDQRLNRQWVRERCNEGDRVLNTFAYTGAFSIVAALGGAVTTTLDLSNPYLNWSRDNFSVNDLDVESHYFCRGDAMEWLGRFAKQGRTFQGVVLDPPSFSRTPKGKAFSVARDYADLAKLAARVIEPGGWLLACCNHHELSTQHFSDHVAEGLERARRPISELNMAPMPPEFAADEYLKSCRVVVG